MKKIILVLTGLLVFVGTHAIAGLESPFPSSVEGINIPNTHVVIEEGESQILRGMAPLSEEDYTDLINYGVQHVLIFKNQTSNEIDSEIDGLFKSKFPMENVSQIPFRWKAYYTFEVACVQTIDALRLIREVYSNGEKMFFHCTVGEDRTGYLAGLLRYLTEEEPVIRDIFQSEMCERGFAAGNPQKPYHVVKAIRKDLTPLLMKMIYKIDNGYLSMDNLNYSTCGYDPALDDEFVNDDNYYSRLYKCQPQRIAE